MRVIPAPHPGRAARSREDGFTMIITILVMFVTSLLLVAAFIGVNGDTENSRLDMNQKQAYFAALAGVQEFEYQLDANPDYWESCPEPKGTVPGTTGANSGEAKESFEVSVLPAASDTESTPKCNSSVPFTSIIESKGVLANTFRIRAIGKSGKETRTLIANFKVAGFLNYVYFTQYETEDPNSQAKGGNPKCENYYETRKALGILSSCGEIEFAVEDSVKGPMHTDDSAIVCGNVEFGRKTKAEAKEWDSVEIDRGTVDGGCGGTPVYNTENGKPETGAELVPPVSDGSLRDYVEHEATDEAKQEYELSGLNYLELNGEKNEIKDTFYNGTKKEEKWLKWPKNGLLYVNEGESGCAYTEYIQTATDTSSTEEKERECGTVYVKGTYSKSLTIGAATDVVINGSITPYGVSGGSAPTGTATLGLIATRFVRIYHPCTYNNGTGSLENPWIYAAILSTSHSFLVDNYNCGSSLGKLGIYGAIGQKFRGTVGTFSGSSVVNGYGKDYLYDERLATDEPPYFLSPLKAGWKIFRETAEKGG